MDLFCGAGGCAVGYHRAGFDVVGVDIEHQPRYPFQHHVFDALDWAEMYGEHFDAIHASPPCQAYILSGTVAKHRAPKLIEPVRRLLQGLGKPFVIENVPGAPLIKPTKLCGSMFKLGVRRHRLFETSFLILDNSLRCNHRGKIVGVYGNAHGKRGAWPSMLPSTRENWSKAMGIDWMQADDLTQAIPPAYTEWIGRKLLALLV